MQSIQAFRDIEIPVDLGDGEIMHIRVPFTVELLRRVEETLIKIEGRVWFRLSKRDQSILAALEEFCRPYFGERFNFLDKDPTFMAVFFSHVRDELRRSIDGCMNSTDSTDE